jgi:hypothetical protein
MIRVLAEAERNTRNAVVQINKVLLVSPPEKPAGIIFFH